MKTNGKHLGNHAIERIQQKQVLTAAGHQTEGDGREYFESND